MGNGGGARPRPRWGLAMGAAKGGWGLVMGAAGGGWGQLGFKRGVEGATADGIPVGGGAFAGGG